MNVSDWAAWAAVVLAAASFLYSVLNGRSKETDQKFVSINLSLEGKAAKDTVAVVAGKLDLLEDRTTRIESDLRHLPDHSTVNELQKMISKLSGDVGVLSERIRPVAAIADRLQEKILEQAGFDR